MTILKAYSYYDGSLKDAKRIYLNERYAIGVSCPECNFGDVHMYDCLPFISYGTYCHVLYCESCSHETKEKMYSINEIGDDFVDVTFNTEVFPDMTVWDDDEKIVG